LKNNEGITFLEEYLKGDLKELMAFWDGKNLIHFDKKEGLTEVQADRLELLKTKMAFMFSDEKADFVGFFNTKLVWSKNDWYVLDFVMHIDESFNLELLDKDFLYILNSAIYQKLNEINF
jgi:phosphoribosylamine-glycine ligase